MHGLCGGRVLQGRGEGHSALPERQRLRSSGKGCLQASGEGRGRLVHLRRQAGKRAQNGHRRGRGCLLHPGWRPSSRGVCVYRSIMRRARDARTAPTALASTSRRKRFSFISNNLLSEGAPERSLHRGAPGGKGIFGQKKPLPAGRGSVLSRTGRTKLFGAGLS